MRLSDIHTALGRGEILPQEQGAAARLAIEAFAQRVELPVFLLDYAPPDLARALPPRPPGPENPGSYFRWRKTLLDLQMRACPGDVDGDPWASLARALRIEGRENDVSLRGLERTLPGVPPSAVTDELLRRAEADVAEDEKARLALRSAVHALRRAYDSPLAQAAGLLPAVRPAPLPALRDHAARAPMAPDVAALHAASDPHKARAIAYVNAVAVAAGLCDGATDTPNDLGAAAMQLPDPASVGVPPVKCLGLYVQSVCAAVAESGHADPRLSPVDVGWDQVKRAGRHAGSETDHLWTIAQVASARGLRPHDITPGLAQDLVDSYATSTMRSYARRGCEQLDALRGHVPACLLPPEPTSVRRMKRRPKPSRPATPPEKKAWAALYAELRRRGATRPDVSLLSVLRTRAEAEGKSPSDLTQAWIDTLEKECAPKDFVRFRDAIRLWNRYAGSTDSMSMAFRPLADKRRSHAPLPECLLHDLDTALGMLGAAPSNRRAVKSATGALRGAIGGDLSADASLAVLLGAYDPDLDLTDTEKRLLASLKDHLSLPWTDAWRALQGAVAQAGIPRKSTPVPRLLHHAGPYGLEPWQLTRDWAQDIDRTLRSTIHHPPHGRADLALTFARKIAALDALHDRPGFRRGDLLPPRIGPIRSGREETPPAS